MTDKATPAPSPPRYTRGGTYWIKRVNFLLRFTRMDLGTLNNGAYEDFLDELYYSLYGQARPRPDPNPFSEFATRANVREAQRGLDRAIRETPGDTASFDLEKQTLTIRDSEDLGFYSLFESEHFATEVYVSFAHLLEASWVRRSDFRHCANDKCGNIFVPLRKPRKGARAFCSIKCRNRIAAIEYRKAKGEALREKERVRSEKRYAAKVAKKFPKAKVKKKPK